MAPSRRAGIARRQGVAACAAVLVLCSAVSAQRGAPSVVFHSPQLGATVSGRSFVIEVEVRAARAPACLASRRGGRRARGRAVLRSLRVCVPAFLQCTGCVLRRASAQPARSPRARRGQVKGFDVPDMGKGVLLLDGARLMEVKHVRAAQNASRVHGWLRSVGRTRMLVHGRAHAPAPPTTIRVRACRCGSST
jgi:hypothetical protein